MSLAVDTQQTVLLLMECVMNIIIYSMKYWRHFLAIT